MVTTLSRDTEKDKVFPVEILRSLHPYIIAGLQSTQTRTRQSTYRFIIASDILSEMHWLNDKDGISLLSAIETAREEFEAEPRSIYGYRLPQINDFASVVLQHQVEKGELHPMTMTPLVGVGVEGEVKWVWYLPDGTGCELGYEGELERDEDKERAAGMNEARVPSDDFVRLTNFQEQRERERLAKKAKDTAERKSLREKRSWRRKEKAAATSEESSQSTTTSKENTPVRSPSPRKRKNPEDAENSGSEAASQAPLTEIPGAANEALQTDEKMEVEEAVPSEPPAWGRGSETEKLTTSTGHATEGCQTCEEPQLSKPFFQAPAYDKRMPPPSVDWKSKVPKVSRRPFGVQSILPALPEEQAPVPGAESRKPVDPANPPPPPKVYVTVATQTSAGQKRDAEEAEFEPMPASNAKRRMLKSDYIPAYHTSWKPDWIENTQCYPVNELGFELSDEKCLRGDVVHRNADRLKRALEQDAMYITTDKVEHLMEIVKETMTMLEKAKEYTDKHPSKVSVKRWKFA